MSSDHSTREELALYFRGHLPGDASATLEAHCAACSICGSALREEAHIELALFEVLEPPTHVDLVPLAQSHHARLRKRARPAIIAIVAAAAGALMLVRGPHVWRSPGVFSHGSSHALARMPAMQARSVVVATLMNLVAVPQAIACPTVPGDTVALAESRARAVQAGLAPLPPGWFRTGAHEGLYATGVDGSHAREGRAPISLGSRPGAVISNTPFESAMTGVDATPFRGRRLRFTGMVRADAIQGSAGLWMRVDGAAKEVLAFDNMGTRSICGTSDFTPYEVVLDVEPAATRIAYGVLLNGAGQVWLDAPRLEVVDASVPTTAPSDTRAAQTRGVASVWMTAGSDPNDFVVSADSDVHREGTTSLSIASRTAVADGHFGTAMQMVSALPFRGKRVRLSADVKTDGVQGWSGLWMRVDGPSVRPFDNMESRPLRGTSDWARYSIVMDVPTDAGWLALGALLDGEGHVWADDVVLEPVSTSVPTTSVDLSREGADSSVEAASTRGVGPRWALTGSSKKDYEISADPGVHRGGGAGVSLASTTASADVFGSAMQAVPAEPYRGARVRLTAYVKTAALEGWAGLWMRVDAAGAASPLAFDNMEARPIKGTTDWTPYSVVLDVAPEATTVALGIVMTGKGHLWIDDVVLEPVSAADVATTGER